MLCSYSIIIRFFKTYNFKIGYTESKVTIKELEINFCNALLIKNTFIFLNLVLIHPIHLEILTNLKNKIFR